MVGEWSKQSRAQREVWLMSPRAGDAFGEALSLFGEYNTLGGLCVSKPVPEYLLLYSHLIRSIQLIFFLPALL
jgi:hypothetical protein